MTEEGHRNSSEDSAALSACTEWSTYVSIYIVYAGVEVSEPERARGQKERKEVGGSITTSTEGRSQ